MSKSLTKSEYMKLMGFTNQKGWSKIVGIILVIIIGLVIIFSIFAFQVWLLMLVWNFVMPVLGVATLTFWQVAALDLVVILLFGFIKSTGVKNE